MCQIDTSTSTCHHHPKSTADIRGHACALHSVGLDQCITTGIHHYSVRQSSFTVLTPTPHASFLLPMCWQPLICLRDGLCIYLFLIVLIFLFSFFLIVLIFLFFFFFFKGLFFKKNQFLTSAPVCYIPLNYPVAFLKGRRHCSLTLKPQLTILFYNYNL